jgi:hypothetical protein
MQQAQWIYRRQQVTRSQSKDDHDQEWCDHSSQAATTITTNQDQ